MSSTEPPGAALVTGAQGPVGAAVIERLQTEGFAVAGLDVKGGGDLPLAADVKQREQVADAVASALRELGRIDVLVTAHGYHASAPFGTMSPEDWKNLLDCHLGGTVNACAAVVPHMVQAGHGIVVTTSSWLALAGVPGEAYYAAATGSILAFTKSFSLEVAPKGVRVNCIAVGPLGAGAPEHSGGDVRSNLGDRLPERYVTPADIADTVSFLVRDGDFFVGQVFNAVAGAVV